MDGRSRRGFTDRSPFRLGGKIRDEAARAKDLDLACRHEVPRADLFAAGFERHRHAVCVRNARNNARDDQRFIKIDAGVVCVVLEAERKDAGIGEVL